MARLHDASRHYRREGWVCCRASAAGRRAGGDGRRARDAAAAEPGVRPEKLVSRT
jgi:hypothetical protein